MAKLSKIMMTTTPTTTTTTTTIAFLAELEWFSKSTKNISTGIRKESFLTRKLDKATGWPNQAVGYANKAVKCANQAIWRLILAKNRIASVKLRNFAIIS